MDARTERIALRGYFALALALAALCAPIALRYLGLTTFDSDRSPDDPYGPSDNCLTNRLLYVTEWMFPSCLLVWAAAGFRARHAAVFDERSFNVLPTAAGVAGLVLLLYETSSWAARPYSGRRFADCEG